MIRRWRLAVEIALLSIVYTALAYTGMTLGEAARFATLVWVPAGMALALLLWRGARLWPGVMIGAFMAGLLLGAPAWVSLAIAAARTAELLLAFVLLNRVADFQPELSRVKDVVSLVFFAAILSTIVSATVGAFSLWLSGIIPVRSIAYIWYLWWTGSGMGILVVTPLLLTWITHPSPRPTLQDFVVWAAVVLSGVVVFSEILPARFASVVPHSYLVFPPLIWGALRLGPRWTATAIAILSAIAITAAMLGRGGFAGPTLTDHLLALQTFMVIVAITISMLSAAIAERKGRDQLISFASHELRNPLGNLSLHYQLLTQSVERGIDPARLQHLAPKFQSSLTRLSQLVDELLDVSRASQGPVALRKSELDLRELVESVASRLSPELERNGSRIELDLGPATGCWDRSRLDQVITNLISNASKYGGTKLITVILSCHAGVARLEIRDRGPGIATADHERIFEPFVRLNGKSDAVGLGLGLAITREIVLAHRGRIWVESAAGAGCRFIVELPCYLAV